MTGKQQKPPKRSTPAKPPKRRSPGTGPPKRSELIAILRTIEADLRRIGSDWQNGLPGDVRQQILDNANLLLRTDCRTLSPTCTVHQPSPPARRKSWLILHGPAP